MVPEVLLFSTKCMQWVVLVARSCLTLCNPMDCSPLGSSVHGIFQAKILEWFAISFSRNNGWNHWLIFKRKKNPSPCPFPHKLEDSMYSRPRVRNLLLLSASSIALDLNLCKMTRPDPCTLTTFASLHTLSLEEISSCLSWHVLHPAQMGLCSPSQRQATVPPQGTSRLPWTLIQTL